MTAFAPLALPTDLAGLVDASARRSGAWVVVDTGGLVLAHGAGSVPCPAAVAESVLRKSTQALREQVRWRRGGRPLRGDLDGVPVVAADLGSGATAWFVAGEADEESLPALAAALTGCEPVPDPGVADLLHPRGPRRGPAPQAVLLDVRSALPRAALYARVRAAVTGTAARLHAEPGLLLVVFDPSADVALVVRELHEAVPDAVIGRADVTAGAADWTAAARLAGSCAEVASELGLPIGDARLPQVAAELVVREARQAADDLLDVLPGHPLHALREADTRGGSDHVATLTAWCRSGFDVPAAAAVLHLHPNTLRYRLRRAEQIASLDLGCPRQLLALQLLLA